MGAWATAIMLIGWGVGGILFGVMADKYGRARMMIITVVMYAGFTGLSGLATSWVDFFIYRFFCGMGVGGFFAAGVTMLAETMPDKARPKTLGLLQVFAAFCNVCACAMVVFCGLLEAMGFFQAFPLWRVMFLVGFIPAVLAFFIMRHLKEPEVWRKAVAAGGTKKAGSIPDLFRHPRWRYNVIIGMCLATCGIIGLWGIGFFSGDLTRMAFRNTQYENVRVLEVGQTATIGGTVVTGLDVDRELIRMLASNPSEFLPLTRRELQNERGTPIRLTSASFIGAIPGTNDVGAIYTMFVEYNNHNAVTVLAALDERGQTAEERDRRMAILEEAPQTEDRAAFEQLVTSVSARATAISGYVTFWGCMSLLLFNLGAIFGTLGITWVAEMMGRRMAFTVFFTVSFFMTILVFLKMGTGDLLGNPEWEVLVLTPIFGFCILSIFGAYAIYFPELFPTRLRSTAISFCYNIARFAAATGPAGLGILTGLYLAFEIADNSVEAVRYAGATMALTFILGIIFAWMGPETKGQPLPEED
jgi:MFS family permease